MSRNHRFDLDAIRRALAGAPIGLAIGSAALIVAAAAADLCYRSITGPEPYGELIAGGIAWNADLKRPDFALLFTFVFSFLSVAIALQGFKALVDRIGGAHAAHDFERLLLLSAIPGALWLGQALASTTYDPKTLHFAAGCTVLVVGCTALSLRALARDRSIFAPVACSVLAIVFGVYGGAALDLTSSRVLLLSSERVLAGLAPHLGGAIAGALVLACWTWPGSTSAARALALRRVLVGSQCALPLMALALVPAPWTLPTGSMVRGYGTGPALKLLIAAALIGSLIELAYRASRTRSARALEGPMDDQLGRLSLLGVLLFLCLPVAGPPAVPQDLYHSAEYLLPWWQLREFGHVPFQDLVPARGLQNYTPGLVRDVFFPAGGAYELSAAAPLSRAFAIAAAFLGFAALLGPGWAFLMVLTGAVLGVMFDIHALNALVLLLLARRAVGVAPATWLLIWLVLGTAAVLHAPGQGGLLVLATMPLGAVMTARAWREERRRALKILLGAGLIAGALAWLTPIDLMIAGAIRYGLEQSAVNSVAHGIAWHRGALGSLLAWEVLRSAWIGVAILVGLIAWKAFTATAIAPRRRAQVLAYAVPAFLMLTLFVLRAAGRIDHGGMSRLGLASGLAVCLVLPSLLATYTAPGRRTTAALGTAFAGGLIMGGFGSVVSAFSPPSARLVLVAKLPDVEAPAAAVGLVSATQEQAATLGSLHRALQAVLAPGETFLDLTDRGTLHFLLGYPSPAESAAYNMSTEAQQLRTIRRLRSGGVPVALVGPVRVLHDGGSASLRTHLVYRWLALNFVPLELEGHWFLVDPRRLAERPGLGGAEAGGARTGPEQRVLTAFVQQGLGLLPSAWGDSFEALSAKLRLVATLTEQPTRVPAEAGAAGPGGAITIDLTALGLSERDAGILELELSGGRPLVPVTVSWGESRAPSPGTSITFAGGPGRFLVPLDSSPRWLLSERLKRLRISFASLDPSSPVVVEAVRLHQRSGADLADSERSP